MGFSRRNPPPASASNAPGSASALGLQADRTALDPVQPSEALRILVVDDNPDSITLMSSLLAALGHAPLTAATADEGLEMALRERPDLVLLDIVLPGMDGHEVMRLMKASPDLAGTPIVALTALTTPGHPTRALEAGFDDYLQKPIDLQRLVAVIGSCAARRERLPDH